MLLKVTRERWSLEMSFKKSSVGTFEIHEMIRILETSRDLARDNNLVFIEYMIEVALLECEEVRNEVIHEIINNNNS